MTMQCAFYVNGRLHQRPSGRSISYGEICGLAGLLPCARPTVTVAYRPEDDLRDRDLTDGQSAPVHPGTVINCVVTGRA
jgi:hypothetical protein